ncbi:MAG: TPM domain-containing protein [Lachnospiraceae bacterium]|nr:TPM domain-containing protein [Lachnospiraceae bacterium]
MKSYFKYFAIPFIIALVITVIALPMYLVARADFLNTARNNSSWDNSVTVLDLADKMSNEEEAALTEQLRKAEAACQTDIVFFIIDDPANGYLDSVRRLADSFSEDNHMGYDYPGGSAIVFVDNWSRGGDGRIHSWMSTTGEIRSRISDSDATEMLNVLDELSDDDDPYYVYSKLGKSVEKKGSKLRMPYSMGAVLFVALVIAVIYIIINWRSKLGDVTVTSGTYLEDGKASFKVRTDTFNHKTVTKHKIERSSGGGGGGGGSHGGGGHSR